MEADHTCVTKYLVEHICSTTSLSLKVFCNCQCVSAKEAVVNTIYAPWGWINVVLDVDGPPKCDTIAFYIHSMVPDCHAFKRSVASCRGCLAQRQKCPLAQELHDFVTHGHRLLNAVPMTNAT